MMLRIANVLDAEQVVHCRRVLGDTPWVDGAVTAGQQSVQAKHNLQVPEDAPQARALQDLILGQLGRNATFISAALPLRVFPPLFNRYEAGMAFEPHIDNAVRISVERGAPYRTDLSCTLFLSDPQEYDGGELVIEGPTPQPPIKLAAGDMILYPASSVHRVTAVTRGARWASFFWVQSMVRSNAQREILHDLDHSVGQVRATLGDQHAAAIRLTGHYHNLLRLWAEV
jgi:PKHD-type hydroxylase